MVNPDERGYFITLSDYMHLNPVRARIVGLHERLVDFPSSSYSMFRGVQAVAERGSSRAT